MERQSKYPSQRSIVEMVQMLADVSVVRGLEAEEAQDLIKYEMWRKTHDTLQCAAIDISEADELLIDKEERKEEQTEYVKFKLIIMPCCDQHVSWVNPMLPMYCPECGAHVFQLLRLNPATIIISDDNAKLIVKG